MSERLSVLLNVWKNFAGHPGDWFDVKTASICTTELSDSLKSFILNSLNIKVAPYHIIVSLDTLIQHSLNSKPGLIFQKKKKKKILQPISKTKHFSSGHSEDSFESSLLRQGPLDLSFWSFLTFLNHGIKDVESIFSDNFIKKIKKKVGQMCHQSCSLAYWVRFLIVPAKLLANIRFLYKVVHKIGRLRKFNCARKIEFNFFTARTIFMKLGTLVHHAHFDERMPQTFYIFAWGLSYGR